MIESNVYFPKVSKRRVLLIVEVCHHIFLSSHLLIFSSFLSSFLSSSHLIILTSSQFLIFSSSHIHIVPLIFPSYHLHFSSYHLFIFSSFFSSSLNTWTIERCSCFSFCWSFFKLSSTLAVSGASEYRCLCHVMHPCTCAGLPMVSKIGGKQEAGVMDKKRTSL